MMIKIKMADTNKFYSAKGYKKIIEMMNSDSMFGSEVNLYHFMDKVKDRVKIQKNIEMNFNNEKEFIKELANYNLIEIIE